MYYFCNPIERTKKYEKTNHFVFDVSPPVAVGARRPNIDGLRQEASHGGRAIPSGVWSQCRGQKLLGTFFWRFHCGGRTFHFDEFKFPDGERLDVAQCQMHVYFRLAGLSGRYIPCRFRHFECEGQKGQQRAFRHQGNPWRWQSCRSFGWGRCCWSRQVATKHQWPTGQRQGFVPQCHSIQEIGLCWRPSRVDL